MRIPGVDKATENLVKWAARDEWEEPHAEIYAAHIDPAADIVDMSGDEIAELLGDSAIMLHVFITEDFFTARFGEDDELNLIDDYLKRRGWREAVSARRYLEALRDSHVSLYEIVDIDPGRSVTVRDLILGGEAVTVDERARLEIIGTLGSSGGAHRHREREGALHGWHSAVSPRSVAGAPVDVRRDGGADEGGVA